MQDFSQTTSLLEGFGGLQLKSASIMIRGVCHRLPILLDASATEIGARWDALPFAIRLSVELKFHSARPMQVQVRKAMTKVFSLAFPRLAEQKRLRLQAVPVSTKLVTPWT